VYFLTRSISDLAGEILAKEGTDDTNTISDVISSIWTDYTQVGTEMLKKENLNFLIVENEDSILMATKLYGYIVAIKAKIDCNVGMTKIHLESIVKFLKEKFSQFKQIIGEKEEVIL
jgi:hypothetical protein